MFIFVGLQGDRASNQYNSFPRKMVLKSHMFVTLGKIVIKWASVDDTWEDCPAHS